MIPIALSWGVGTLAGRVTGKTWISSAAYSGAVTWTTSQLYQAVWLGRTNAMARLGWAGRAVWGMSVGGLTTGVLLGMGGGIAVSQLLFGDEGRKDAIDLYTGKVSVPKYIETIAAAPKEIARIVEANRAVPNNAAGLPTGMPIDSTTNQPRGFNSPSGQNPFAYGDGPAWYA